MYVCMRRGREPGSLTASTACQTRYGMATMRKDLGGRVFTSDMGAVLVVKRVVEDGHFGGSHSSVCNRSSNIDVIGTRPLR